MVKSPLLSLLRVFMLCMEAVGSFYQYQSLHEDNAGRGSCLVVFCLPAAEGAAAETALVELMSFTIHCSEQLIQLLAVEHIADIGTFCYSSCSSSLSLKLFPECVNQLLTLDLSPATGHLGLQQDVPLIKYQPHTVDSV